MALTGKYISVSYIIENYYRNFKFLGQLDFYDAMEHIWSAMNLINVPQQYITKIDCIKIENYKGELPCDLHKIEQCRVYETNIPMRYATDSFHSPMHCEGSPDIDINSDATYKLDNSHIKTSFKEGTVEIAYYAFPTDDEGYPMIPDNEKFVKAITSYLAERKGFQLFMEGKLDVQRYNKLEVEWLFYVGAAQNAARMPSIDQMESLKNQWLRLIPRIAEHSRSFRDLGSQETRYSKGKTNR